MPEKKSVPKKAGYSLIELLVTVSIFIIISATVLANYPKFGQKINLIQASEETALGIREAQTRAMAVQAFRKQSGELVYPPYGIHFEKSKSKEFIIFADINENGLYDSANHEEASRFLLRNASISDLCLSAGEEPPADCAKDTIDIVYKRPEPTITIKSGSANSSLASIIVSATSAGANRIVVWISGQIYVESIQ